MIIIIYINRVVWEETTWCCVWLIVDACYLNSPLVPLFEWKVKKTKKTHIPRANKTKWNKTKLCGPMWIFRSCYIPFSVTFRNFWNNAAFPFIMERKAAQGLTIWLGIRLVGTSFQQDVMIFVMPALLIAFYFSFHYRTYLNNFISREHII